MLNDNINNDLLHTLNRHISNSDNCEVLGDNWKYLDHVLWSIIYNIVLQEIWISNFAMTSSSQLTDIQLQ